MTGTGFNGRRDGGRILVLAGVSLAIGWGINLARISPLSWSYQSPEQRLAVVIQQLGTDRFAPATERVDEMNLAELRRAHAAGQVQFIDARPPLFYEHGHLPGALPLSHLQFSEDYEAFCQTVAPARAKGSWLVVYCAGDDCHDSELVAAALVRLGYDRVRLFRGGYAEWTRAGLPVEKHP